MNIRSIEQLVPFAGMRVLLRLDLNVPIQNGVVFDDFRIKKSLPTIEWLVKNGAKIIIISHCENKEAPTLRPVFEHLKKILPISFVEHYVDGTTRGVIDTLQEGQAVLFENLRQYAGEKENDEQFAISLASLADVYVNEAFSVSHREHASIVGIPKHIPGYAGFLFQKEVSELSKAFTPPHPFLFILGGAKFDTKIPLIERFLTIADNVFVGGALANNFFREQGYTIGASVVSDGDFGLSAMFSTKKVVLPEDVVVKRGEVIETKSPQEVLDDDVILDVGPRAVAQLKKLVAESACVLWNGPLGNFEVGFTEATLKLAETISKSSAHSIVGGADTLAAIAELDLESHFNFVSSGGGAMLDFLSRGTLPGIEALRV